MGKPRKKYRPKPVLSNPLDYVLEGVRPPNPHSNEVAALHVANHTAAHQLSRGQATTEDMKFLVTMSNMTEAMWCQGIGKEYESELKAGQDALVSVCTRGKDSGRYVATGPELTAINQLIELHDAQFETISVSELMKATSYVLAEIRAKRFRVIG